MDGQVDTGPSGRSVLNTEEGILGNERINQIKSNQAGKQTGWNYDCSFLVFNKETLSLINICLVYIVIPTTPGLTHVICNVAC